MGETKVCKGPCGRERPLGDFYRVNGTYRTMCKLCFRALSSEQYALAVQMGREKPCSECNHNLPIAHFHRQPGGLFGASSKCVSCARSLLAAAKVVNPDRTASANRRYRERLGDIYRAKQRQDYQDQRAKKLLAARDYLARHGEEVRAKHRAWRKLHPDAARDRDAAERAKYRDRRAEDSARRRALMAQAAIGETVDRAAIILRDRGACYLCGRQPRGGQQTLDHVIPLARGGIHDPSNLRVACRRCNSRKGDKLLAELDWYIPLGEQTA
jgi:5-methylcytosine-specific restriction endonuclease McrA